MKKYVYYVLLVVTLFSVNSVSGQNNIKSGANYSSPFLNKFIGNWVWVNKTDTIWLHTKVENVKLPAGQNLTADVLVGYFKQVKGKKLVRDSFKMRNQKYSGKTTHFVAGINQSGDKIDGYFNDVEANRNYNLQLILNNDRSKLEISILGPTEGLRIGQSTSSTIPKNITFIKIK